MPKKTASAGVQAALRMMDERGYVAALDERVRDHAVALLCVLAYRGFGRLEVFSGRRTLEQQEILYGHGRSAEECKAVGVNPAYADPGGPVVTWSRPEESMHVRGLAIDLGVEVYSQASWAEIGRIGERMGWRWGGRWRVRDYSHFERVPGRLNSEVE